MIGDKSGSEFVKGNLKMRGKMKIGEVVFFTKEEAEAKLKEKVN